MHGVYKIGAAASTLLFTAGCVPSARLEAPPPLLSTDWSFAAEGRAPNAGGDDASRAGESLAQMMRAPELERLVIAARLGNSDIRVAAAKVRQARALLKIARGAALPDIKASAGGSRILSSSGTNSSQFSNPFDFNEIFAQVDAEIDLDLFGRNKAVKHSALARARAAELTRAATMLTVETSVASAYVNRAALARRIEINDASIARAEDLERIIRARVKEGETSRVDLGIQSGQLLNLRAERIELVQALDRTRTALALLTGAEAPRFSVAPGRLDDLALPAISPLRPAQVLSRRPDILVAEAMIEAANGDVAQARASFFPTITLSAHGLIESALTSGPLSQSTSLGASLIAPIFARGRLKGELEFASASQVEAVAAYRGSIVTALSEVEDAIMAVEQARQRDALLAAIVDEARQTAKLARQQYVEGEADLQRVLDAEQSLGAAEDAQALSRLSALLARITLYRTTGGSLPACGGGDDRCYRPNPRR